MSRYQILWEYHLHSPISSVTLRLRVELSKMSGSHDRNRFVKNAYFCVMAEIPRRDINDVLLAPNPPKPPPPPADPLDFGNYPTTPVVKPRRAMSFQNCILR